MRAFKNRTILVVEDVEETLHSLCKMLTKHFKVLYTARDGKSALKVYRTYMPDFVLTDMSIPLSSGEELCREIRQINPSQKLIVMTGHKDMQWDSPAWNALIYKPIDYSELSGILETLEAELKAPSGEKIAIQNLLQIPELGKEEETELLCQNRNTRIVRIVSPGNFISREFVQEEDEWVALLQGQARLEIEGEEYVLNAGQGCLLKSGVMHRVLYTSENPLCIWLAVHMET